MSTKLNAGQTFESVLVDDLTRTQLVQYAGTSGDYNPVHTDERFATEVAGYPSVFAHGMLTMGMSSRALDELVGVENITSFGGRFTSQVWPGDTLTNKIAVDSVEGDVAALTITVTNQKDVVVYSGQATVKQ
ncbi:MAG: MaoC/PaaZ C-terminal domain-containing protein [Cumulibacter sp.]